jgi:prophage regulatory protein
MNKPAQIIRLAEVKARTGLSTSAIYEAVAASRFPRQLKISTKSVGWLASEIDAWIEDRRVERDGENWQTLGDAAKRVIEKLERP